MPYSVDHLIEDQGNVLVIHKNDQIIAALDLMIEHDYSQLPVVDEEDRLLGMITYESIMRATRSFNTKLDKLSVRDAIVNAPKHYIEDDLFDLLDELKDTNAVVIIEPNGIPIRIVTSYDTSEYLRDRTEDLMHVEDIEFTVKELIKKAYANSRAELDHVRLDGAIANLNEQRSDLSSPKKTKAFEDLTLSDYINLLISRDTWEFIEPILKIQKESLYELLEKVRLIRNDLAHFRGDISTRRSDELKYCASWLRSRYQEYEKEQERTFINAVIKQGNEIKLPLVVGEEPVVYKSNVEDFKITKDEKSGSRSRYTALANWLAQQKETKVELTFEAVEGIIGSPLPDSARVFRAWWANDSVGHTHSILWLDAGWKVDTVDFNEKWVRFKRYRLP